VHRLYEKADKLSREIIGAAMEVHRHKGPGLRYLPNDFARSKSKRRKRKHRNLPFEFTEGNEGNKVFSALTRIGSFFASLSSVQNLGEHVARLFSNRKETKAPKSPFRIKTNRRKRRQGSAYKFNYDLRFLRCLL
jgi:hypothetical protein